MRDTEIMAGHGPKGEFDAAHLKAIHQYLFQDVYEWAGRTRDEPVRLSDGTVATQPLMSKGEGEPFLSGSRLPIALDEIAQRLREADYLRGLSREDFAVKAAHILTGLNTIHPFREGNGRTQRTFLRELAREAGHDLDFSVITKERMIGASIAAHEQGDRTVMHRLFRDALDPDRRNALRDAIEFLDKEGFAWNDRYIATAEPGHRVEVFLVGINGEHFMARTTEQILIGDISDLPVPRPQSGQLFVLDPGRHQADLSLAERFGRNATRETDAGREHDREPEKDRDYERE